MFDRRELGSVLALLIACLLQSCVTSELPLLDDKTAIADSALTGHYRSTEGLPGGEKKIVDYDIYLKDKTYLIAQKEKLIGIATLHQLTATVYLGQLRSTVKALGATAKRDAHSEYLYVLVRQSAGGLEINTIPCLSDCTLSDIGDLNNFANDTVDNFTGPEYWALIKTGDLGR